MPTYADWTAQRILERSRSGSGSGTNEHAAGVTGTSAALNGGQPEASQLPAHDDDDDDAMQLDPSTESIQAVIADVRKTRSAGGDSDGRAAMPQTGTSEVEGASSVTDIPAETIMLVIDTNYLISHLHVFRSLEEYIPRLPSCGPVLFVLSIIVLRELDGLKKSTSAPSSSSHGATTASLARTAASTMLSFLQNRPDLFRGQRTNEGLYSDNYGEKSNDERILDCCLFYRERGSQVGILTEDVLLSNLAQSHGIPPLAYAPQDRNPAHFLGKLSPHVVERVDSLRVRALEMSAGPTTAMDETPQYSASVQQQGKVEHLRRLQDTLMQAYRSAYPLNGPELLLLVSKVTAALLSPYVYATLLSALAGDSRETLAQTLAREPVFRHSRGVDENRVLEYERTWSPDVCLKLLDRHWRHFVEQGKAEGGMQGGGIGAGRGKAGSSIRSGDPGLMASRWASSSVRATRPGLEDGKALVSGTGTAAPFHPSKLSALASSMAHASEMDDPDESKAAAVQKWTSLRWNSFLDDLDGLLRGSGAVAVLREEEDRERAHGWVTAWKANVELWREL